jgi:amino acid transporter
VQLHRGLSLTGLVALTFFCVAGGAFGVEDGIAAGGPLVVLLMILILPWLWSLPTALMTAELSTAMPEDGGYVVWVEKAFGRFWGFQEGWLSWLCSFADNALYPIMFLDYLAYMAGDISPQQRWLLGTAVIGMITGLNVRGIRVVGVSSVIFTIFVLAPFAVMVVLGVPQIQPTVWLTKTGTLDWALLLSIVLWNTCGWDNAGCCAGEVDKPTRNYPRAMTVTVLLVTFTYLLPVAVGVSIDTNWADWREGHFPKIAAQIGGSWLGIWLTIAALVSAAGLFNALLCTSSRVSYSMAARDMLPRPLATLHSRYATPWIAIGVNSIGVACLIPFSFQELIQIDMFLYALALTLEFAALVWLRIKRPDMPRPYRVPGGVPGAIALSIPPVALCLLSIGLAGEATQLVGMGALAAGLLVYYFRFKIGKESEPEPMGPLSA